ncbi:MAG TPA: DsbA family protein [Azospirillaceae bacterium]|nr:DsbA family protein [Azospirillaceae bacterium]
MRRYVLRSLLAAAGALALSAALPALSGTAAAQTAPAIDLAAATSERVMGDPKAPVTIIEYASLTCPHCAAFHETVLPKLKADFVDTGQVRFIFRDFPLDALALRAAMVARCMPPDRYFPMLSALFKTQRAWATAADPGKAMAQTAKLGGMSDAQFQACVTNQQLQQSVAQSRLTGIQKYNVTGTPSFYDGDGNQLFEVVPTYEQFVEKLVALGAKKPAAK